ncbi:YtjB family periplasmic protein [Agarivorans sp. MS3-6]|uniref:YtjB family periplasmic protein n=1 Tax=Agarivorans sp. TSD2052 TaxID=2937286 RepID=UPI00200DF428|nr:AhpA/YtjB family protein [Agarivorans sp. TSD2052]UPW17860.1 YtjB family periplasmic protein [Agarivorans sp. TSD2052]
MAKSAVRRYRIIQFTQLLLAIACCVWVLYYYVDLKHSGEQLIENQTEKLARSLTSLAALNAAGYIGENNQDDLTELVNALVKEHFVKDATIYNHQGLRLAASQLALPLSQILPLAGNSHTPLEGLGRRPYIAEIRGENGDNLGYLRITLEHTALLAEANTYITRGQSKIMIMFLMSISIGFLLTRVLSRKRHLATLFNINARARRKKTKQANKLLADIAARSNQ